MCSVANIRKYEYVNGECSENSQKVLMPLDEKTKYRDQWMLQASDLLTDEQRTTINISLTKSVKSKMITYK